MINKLHELPSYTNIGIERPQDNKATFNEQSQNPLAQNRNNSVSKLHHKQTSRSDYIQSDKLKEYTGTCSENPVQC